MDAPRPTSELAADVKDALESFPGAPCSCPKHKYLLDARDSVDALVARITDLESQVRETEERLEGDLWLATQGIDRQKERAVAAEAQVAALTQANEAHLRHAEMARDTDLVWKARAVAAEAALATTRQALEAAERYATHDPGVDWPSEKHDDPIDAIMAAHEREREQAHDRESDLGNALARERAKPEGSFDQWARLQAAEAQVAALTQERDQWKNRAEYEEDQKRIASSAYLEWHPRAEAAEAALATARQALAEIKSYDPGDEWDMDDQRDIHAIARRALAATDTNQTPESGKPVKGKGSSGK